MSSADVEKTPNSGFDFYERPTAKKVSVTVHVANKHNAGSADASCSLGFPGPELHEFMSNHVLERRSIHTFHVDDISGDGDFSSMNLACSSQSQDGLMVEKIVVHGENADYEGAVNSVFDDDQSCNTLALADLSNCGQKGAGKCCNKQISVALKQK